jgi:predicted RNA binding protein YcfA (HicA-like mRNA interferase family)
MSWRELILRLRLLGFVGPYEGGKHPYMVKNKLVLTLPNPHKGAISVDLLQRLLRQANISRNEWLKTAANN